MIYDGDLYSEAALAAATANTKHAIPFGTMPKDIQMAFLSCQHELGDLISTGRATAVDITTTGFWFFHVKGNPIILASDLKEQGFHEAQAWDANVLFVRRITFEEVKLFNNADQAILMKALTTNTEDE